MGDDLPDVDPDIVEAAAHYAWENGCLLACPGTEQGESGWYFDEMGHRGQWAINEVDGAMIWELVQKFKMEAEEAEWQAEEVLSASEQKFKEVDLDSDGFLVREELESLVVWVFESFFPSRAKLSDDEVKSEAVKLLKYLDKNEDAQVDYPEFGKWFDQKQAQLVKIQRRRECSAGEAKGPASVTSLE